MVGLGGDGHRAPSVRFHPLDVQKSSAWCMIAANSDYHIVHLSTDNLNALIEAIRVLKQRPPGDIVKYAYDLLEDQENSN
jgi:hypothetical protein